MCVSSRLIATRKQAAREVATPAHTSEQTLDALASPGEFATHVSSRIVRGTSFCVSVPREILSRAGGCTIHSPISVQVCQVSINVSLESLRRRSGSS
jgi:hypothetical protein